MTASDDQLSESAAGVEANVLTADTTEPASANASAANATITVGGVTIMGQALSSQASASCAADGTRTTSGSSFVGTVTTPLGTEIVGDDHQDIPIAGVGVLHLNESDEETTGTGDDRAQVRTQRALWLEITNASLLAAGVGDVIVGESIADIHGNPCDAPLA